MSLANYAADHTQLLTQTIREEIVAQVAEQVTREFGITGLRNPRLRASIRQQITSWVTDALNQRHLHSPGTLLLSDLIDGVIARTVGLGFLDQLLPPARNDLIEIVVLPSGGVYVKRKHMTHFEPVNLQPPAHEVIRIVDVLLGSQNLSLTEATPSVNAKLPRSEDNPGGGRVKAIHPLIAPGLGFPALSIRLFEPKPVTPQQIVAWNSATQEMLDVLADVVRRKLRILIGGGTGTGKTTLLSALCNAIPETERIVKIEDPEEIFLSLPHVVTLEARTRPPGSQAPPYTISDAVDDAMRMAPDRLIVGEVRTGTAALALFRAQMSDHPGLSTFHAEDPRSAEHRLGVIMWSDAGVRMDAAKAFFSLAVDVYVQLNYIDGQRRVTGIWQVEPELRNGNVAFTPIFDEQHTRVGELTRMRTAG